MSDYLGPYEHVTNPRTVAQENFDLLEARTFFAHPNTGAGVGAPLGGRVLSDGSSVPWKIDELYIDQNRDVWICTAPGTPGTWRPYVSQSAVDAHYVHTQDIPSDEWTITHNLSKRPSVTVVDSADREVIGDVEFFNSNVIVIRFNGSFSGKAYLN